MKRYQECNPLVKLWRRRHYLYVPFKWLYYSVFEFKVRQHEDPEEYDVIKGRTLWGILTGSAQGDMKWYYTMDEMKERFKKYEDE